MRKNRLHWILPALLIAVLFFGCGRKPGEKLYSEALAEWKAGNPVRARALLEKSIRRRTGSSHNADAYNRLGLLLWEMGEVDASVDAFSESCRIDAVQYGPLCNLGVALSAQNDFIAAERAFREAALLQPNDSRPLAYAGVAYLQNGKWEDASRNLRRALGRTPSNPQLQTLLAIAELHTRGADVALRRLQTVVREHPDYAPALFNLASLHLHWLQNPADAKRNFERYLEKASGIDAFSATARANLQALGDPVEKPSLTITPPKNRDRKSAETYFREATALHRAGELKKAIGTYIQALEKDDTYERAFYNLGLAYYASGEMTLAGEAFGRAVQLNPAFTDARYNAALVDHYYLNQTDRALRELNKVLTQKPDYQPAIDLLKRIKEK